MHGCLINSHCLALSSIAIFIFILNIKNRFFYYICFGSNSSLGKCQFSLLDCILIIHNFIIKINNLLIKNFYKYIIIFKSFIR